MYYNIISQKPKNASFILHLAMVSILLWLEHRVQHCQISTKKTQNRKYYISSKNSLISSNKQCNCIAYIKMYNFCQIKLLIFFSLLWDYPSILKAISQIFWTPKKHLDRLLVLKKWKILLQYLLVFLSKFIFLSPNQIHSMYFIRSNLPSFSQQSWLAQ